MLVKDVLITVSGILLGLVFYIKLKAMKAAIALIAYRLLQVRRYIMLYNPRNYQKSINKSIRLSQPVYDYIMQAPGDGFNQKFENIIIDAKESEARRQETLKMLDDRIEDLQADYNSCYDRLRKLEPMVQVALHINSLVKEFDSSVGKILEDARKRVSQ